MNKQVLFFMNLNAKDLAKKFFNKFFWRQHPEAALRYLPVVSAIKRSRLTNSKILEIGSGSLGIIPYLKKNIDGVDINFSGPQTPLLNKIKGRADDLPFRKNSYDVVISVDVIEHLPKNVRERAIFEQLRVSRKLAVIVVPISKLSEEQDRELYAYWHKIFKAKSQFLQEHIENELPSVDEILVWIDKSARKLKKDIKVRSKPILNLLVRKYLMRTWISKNKYIYYLYLKGYLLLLPLLRLANFGNCYRRIFVIELQSSARSSLEPYSDRIDKAKDKT